MTQDQKFDIAKLSEKQQEILRRYALGYGTTEIAKQLYRSKKTIEAHKQTIKDKLGITDGTQWMSLLRQFPCKQED